MDTATSPSVPRPPPWTLKRKRSNDWVSANREYALFFITSEQIEPSRAPVYWLFNEPELVCSYNWVDDDTEGSNTIYVPGGPPKWIGQPLPIVLPPDRGFYYVDENYARMPAYPYDPMFTALSVMRPYMNFSDVDILADRNNLTMLLGFIRGWNTDYFRMDLHLVNNTLILVRKGETFQRYARPGRDGYGHTFEKAFTHMLPGMEDAGNHYRVMRYKLGSLQLVIRAEIDAYIDLKDGNFDEDDIEELISGNGYEPFPASDDAPLDRQVFNSKAPIHVEACGRLLRNAALAELKCTQGHIKCQHQMWFGRTLHLLTAKCKDEPAKGTVVAVNYTKMREKLEDWEDVKQESLRKLVSLLTRLRDLVRPVDGPVKALALVRESRDSPLVVYSMGNKQAVLREEFVRRHWY